MQKKALLVGINKYKDAPLRGCVNDVIIMFQILTSKFGFSHSDIRVLTDYEATKQNIIDNLQWLTQGVNEDDKIVFHYSGHGSQVTVDDWTNTIEADGRDEILCPVDLDWNNPLRDHEIGAYFKTVPQLCDTLVLLDCCHSGTGLRNGFGPKELYTESDWINRFISPPVSNILSNPSVIIKDDLSFDFPEPTIHNSAVKSGFLIDTTEQGDAILISGCEDNQVSADAWVGSKYHGIMTYCLSHVLCNSGFNITYRNLVTEINTMLDSYAFTQNPQLECKADFFDKKFLR